MEYPSFELESVYWKENKLVAGVDEAGRGPLAGPVFAAAVILDQSTLISGLNDSKKLTDKSRRKLYETIYQRAVDVSVAFVGPEEIDEINILNASIKAMKKALDGLRVVPNYILIDGNQFDNYDIPFKTIVKGDSLSFSIAAASVIAKVTRDDYMVEQASKNFPQYGFERHKGYPTDFHYQALEKYGPCSIHRKTFIKNIYSVQESLF